MRNPCPYSWKKCNFAHKLCKNGLHLGKERALCTRFAPSLAHVLLQHIFLLLNFSDELRPLTRLYEQDQMYIGAVRHCADFNHSTFGAVAGLSENMGRGLRFLYARIVLGQAKQLRSSRCSPQDLDEKINN